MLLNLVKHADTAVLAHRNLSHHICYSIAHQRSGGALGFSDQSLVFLGPRYLLSFGRKQVQYSLSSLYRARIRFYVYTGHCTVLTTFFSMSTDLQLFSVRCSSSVGFIRTMNRKNDGARQFASIRRIEKLLIT